MIGDEYMAADKESLTLKVSTVTKWMSCGGLLLIIISKFASIQFKNDGCWNIVFEIVEVIGTTLLSAGLVSVIVEISTIKSLVFNAFRNILSGDLILDGLNKNALMKLKYNIVLKLLDNPKKDLNNSPYKYENNLLHSVNEKYYEHHNITYHII